MEKKTEMGEINLGGETHNHHYPEVVVTDFSQNVSALGGAALCVGLAAAASAAAYAFVKEATADRPRASAAGVEMFEDELL